jgi:hypothetical protein
MKLICSTLHRDVSPYWWHCGGIHFGSQLLVARSRKEFKDHSLEVLSGIRKVQGVGGNERHRSKVEGNWNLSHELDVGGVGIEVSNKLGGYRWCRYYSVVRYLIVNWSWRIYHPWRGLDGKKTHGEKTWYDHELHHEITFNLSFREEFV